MRASVSASMTEYIAETTVLLNMLKTKSLYIQKTFTLIITITITLTVTVTLTLSQSHSLTHSGVTRPRPCVFLSAACPHERMANPLTYTIAGILLSMFIVFILSYEFFVYRRVKSQVRL